MHALKRSGRSLGMLLVCLLLTSCEEQSLYTGLSEQEANEMVALMYSAGLEGDKQFEKGGTWSVLTSRTAFPDAMALLLANDLPRKRFESLGDVFEKSGFVSSPLEERARLNHALSQEMAHTLSSIDGVILARVHLTLPRENRLSSEVGTASAAVFIKHHADVQLDDSVSRIKSLVVDGVEHLNYADVTVVFFAARPANLLSSRPTARALDQEPLQVVKMQVWPGGVSLGWWLVPAAMLLVGSTYLFASYRPVDAWRRIRRVTRRKPIQHKPS